MYFKCEINFPVFLMVNVLNSLMCLCCSAHLSLCTVLFSHDNPRELHCGNRALIGLCWPADLRVLRSRDTLRGHVPFPDRSINDSIGKSADIIRENWWTDYRSCGGIDSGGWNINKYILIDLCVCCTGYWSHRGLNPPLLNDTVCVLCYCVVLHTDSFFLSHLVEVLCLFLCVVLSFCMMNAFRERFFKGRHCPRCIPILHVNHLRAASVTMRRPAARGFTFANTFLPVLDLFSWLFFPPVWRRLFLWGLDMLEFLSVKCCCI